VASLDLLIFNNLCASEIWPNKRDGLRQEKPDKRGTTVSSFVLHEVILLGYCPRGAIVRGAIVLLPIFDMFLDEKTLFFFILRVRVA
jgi:hypothetical protein